MADDREYDPAVFLRKSKKGQHIVGFMPEKVEPDMVLIISIEGLRDLVRGKGKDGKAVTYLRSSLLPPTPADPPAGSSDEL